MSAGNPDKTLCKSPGTAGAKCAPQIGGQQKKIVSAADVSTQLEALKSQFDRYNKLSTIQKVDTHIKIDQMNLTDLNPYEAGDQGHEKNKSQQKHETEAATDEDLKGKSAED